MKHTFKSHKLSEADRLWLTRMVEAETLDPKVLKVELWGRLPKGFEPEAIDPRLCRAYRPTPVGLWHIDAEHSLLSAIDRTMVGVRQVIIAQPGIEVIEASDIATRLGLGQAEVARAFFELGQLLSIGRFFTSATGSSATPSGYDRIELRDANAYDEYLRYDSLDDLLERQYIAFGLARMPTVPLASLLPDLPWRDSLARPAARKDAAFVLMAMDPSKPDLEDIYNAVKECCRTFDIEAYRADEIQHQDSITDVILEQIRTCEYLIADLTYERPNVYYEVGFAHALNKKPILYRRAGTALHFDLAVHNVPMYRNASDLRQQLNTRLRAITGRAPR